MFINKVKSNNEKVKKERIFSNVFSKMKNITNIALLSILLSNTGCTKNNDIIKSNGSTENTINKPNYNFDTIEKKGKEGISKQGKEPTFWFKKIDYYNTSSLLDYGNAIGVREDGKKCLIWGGEKIGDYYDNIEIIGTGFIVTQKQANGKTKQSYTKKGETPKYWYDSMEHLVDDFFIVKEVYEEGGRGEGVSKNGEKPKVWFSFIDRKRVFSVEKKNPSDFELAVLGKGWGMSVNGEEPKKWYDDICEFYKVYGLGSYGERTSECGLKE